MMRPLLQPSERGIPMTEEQEQMERLVKAMETIASVLRQAFVLGCVIVICNNILRWFGH